MNSDDGAICRQASGQLDSSASIAPSPAMAVPLCGEAIVATRPMTAGFASTAARAIRPPAE